MGDPPAAGPRPSRGAAIPNGLTLLRIAAAAAFPFVPAGTRAGILVFALVTEYADGALARRFGWESGFGRLMDPIADKLLFGVVAAVYLSEGALTWVELCAYGVRDLAVGAGTLVVALGGRARDARRMKPAFFGKLATVFQYAAFAFLVAGERLPTALTVVAAAVGLAAVAQYAAFFRSGSRGAATDGAPPRR